MDFELSLSSYFINYIRDYLLDRELDFSLLDGFEDLLDQTGDDFHIPVSTIAEFYNKLVTITGNENLGMDTARGFHFESSGLIVLLMLSAPTVEQSIKALVQHDRHFDSAIDVGLDIQATQTTVSTSLINPTNIKIDQINEYLMAFLHAAFTKSTRKPTPLKEVWFEHAAYKDVGPLEAFFACPVLFGQKTNCIIFDSQYLREKLYSANPSLFELLSQMMRGFSVGDSGDSKFMAAICREIIRQSKSETPNIDSVASSMALSGRTLRRRLADHGYTFQEVKNLAREKKAKYFLEHTTMSLSEIAYELGYSELSAFSRAYRSWTGESPQAFRDS